MLENGDGLTVAQTENLAATQKTDAVVATGAAERLASGTGTAADQAAVMDGSATNLVSAAGTGFKLDPQAAVALATSCGESIAILQSVQHHLYVVSQAPNLGSLPGVSDIANFTASVGSDGQGVEKAVNSLMSTLNQMQTAYEKAAADYQETEQQVADAMKSFKLPTDPQA